jgi:hypothetical protein
VFALSRDDLATDAASGTWDGEARTIVRDTVERFVVGAEQIQIRLKARAWESTAPDGED